jgi:uncharacterized protein
VTHQFGTPPAPGAMNPALPVASQTADVRSRFMTRVYLHVLAAIGGFIAVEYVLFTTGLAYDITLFVMETNWLLILGGFMIVSWMANSWGYRAETTGAQYGALGLLVIANALLFAAPLVLAQEFAPEGTISTAAWISILAFAGLSGIAITTGKDFSFLRSCSCGAGCSPCAPSSASVLFGTQLGTWFSIAMIGFAGAAILYDTQKIYQSLPAEPRDRGGDAACSPRWRCCSGTCCACSAVGLRDGRALLDEHAVVAFTSATPS